tara:strand:+ start:17443 stop:18543 length:1101 start_codon:yes stop_codon:yes gene_type:complete
MDFTIEKETLLSALTTLSKINPTRTTLPILSTVLIKTTDTENITLRSTDLEVELEIEVNAKVLELGETCAPIYKLLEISNTITEPTVSINVNETQRMRIKTSTGKYLLMCNKTEEFPDQRQINEKPQKLSAKFLRETIKKTTYACSKDELKPTLNGVLFTFSSTSVTAVSTDGHRLVKYVCQQENQHTETVLVPQKFLNIIGAGAINTKKAQLQKYTDYISIETEKTKLSSRLISEKFPDYENVIPQESENETTVTTKLLLSAVKKVSLMSNKTTKQIVLKLQNNKIFVSAEDHETGGAATDEVEAQTTGQELTIGFNSTLLTDILKHQETEEIKILTSSALSATLFKPVREKETNTTTLLMPIRI